uniref:NADH dehydrogenase subunit 6 n=1 Tax=Cobbenicoris guangxiensis TaxID=3020184 RepID=UPI0024114468|nr:NADH dehydrogenase subunit 6 [Cobbenicoris guangxiensis]WEM32405.1 NADH dehydrogenase subunit 6 [Cobbenicoris guangxiensis]
MTIMILILSYLIILFMLLKHPLSMSIMLITQTLMISMIMGITINTFVMSYIIMIIMISGMLVLFVYMSSVSSNEKFKFSFKNFITMTVVMTMLNSFNLKMKFMNNMEIMMKLKETMMIMKLFNEPINLSTLMMIIYLLMTMIVVSNIVNISKGPLKTKNYE